MKTAPLAAIALMLIAPLTFMSGDQVKKTITPATLAALETWVQAVKTHTPGLGDASVVTVAGLSYETREEMDAGMALFLKALVTGKATTDGSAIQRAIVALGRAVGPPFLKQAAILHSDAAAYTDLNPQRQPPGTRVPASGNAGDAVSPLLRSDRVILDKDGQVLGEVVSTWNWPFARNLLDLLDDPHVGPANSSSAPPADPFVAAWYHATTAYMFASGLYREAAPHLRRAAEVLPDDPLILFDRGCYAEILGLPMHQTLEPAAVLGIPPADKTNAEAERLFRRALAIDPSLVEARVRLARLLSVRGRHAEAAAELKTALAASPTGVVAFYAHLFAGRAAQAMRHSDEASRHYQEASALFPDAQSAILASSRLALMTADVPAAVAPVQRLGTRSAVFTADPWWQYHLASGRDAETLLRALWSMVPLR